MKKTYLCGIAAAALLAACTMVFISCGGGGGGGGGGNPTPYEITISPHITGGTLTTNPSGKATEGTSVTITADPTPPNAIEGLPVVKKETDGTNVPVSAVSGEANKFRFTMPPDDVIVSALFDVPGTTPFTAKPGLSLLALPVAIQYTITDSIPAADSYTVYYVEGSGKTAAEIKAGTPVIASQKSGSISGLTAGTTYSVLVKASKSGYIAADSDIKTAAPLASGGDGLAVYLPEGVTASPSTGLVAGAYVQLNITPPSGKAPVFVTVKGLTTGNQVRVDRCSDFTMPNESVSVSVTYGPQQAIPIFVEGELGMDRQIWNDYHDVEGYYTWQETADPGFLGGINGNPALEITLDEQWSQLLFCAADGQGAFDISSFNALSFWVRGDTEGKFASAAFGGGDVEGEYLGYLVTYTGEDNDGIPFTTEWSRVIVPVPKPADGTIIRALHFTAGDGLLYGKTLWIDRAEFVNCDVVLDSIELIADTIPAINSGSVSTPVSEILYGNMKVKYIVDGQTVTLVNGGNVDFFEWFAGGISYTVSGGGVTQSGGELSNGTSGADYSLSIGFGGKTSNTAGLKVSTLSFIVMDNFTQVSDAIPDQPAKFGDTGGGAWWIGHSTEFGPNSAAVMVNGTGDANFTRIHNGPWNLSVYDAITINYLVKSVGGAQETGAVPANCRAFIDVREGPATWRQCTTALARTNYATWSPQVLRKSQFPGTTNWANITAWRIRIVSSPAAGTVHFVSDLRATTLE
ncbi:MAG: hypothetical protein LBB72_06485 [Spirochaetaceae bacterium]|jgi:hypothetical protein|nr:hypothetical protein [Spirochaetaceae bacterium]